MRRASLGRTVRWVWKEASWYLAVLLLGSLYWERKADSFRASEGIFPFGMQFWDTAFVLEWIINKFLPEL